AAKQSPSKVDDAALQAKLDFQPPPLLPGQTTGWHQQLYVAQRMKNSNNQEPIHKYAEEGNVQSIQGVLSLCEPYEQANKVHYSKRVIAAKDNWGSTPIFLALVHGNIETAAHLLCARGAHKAYKFQTYA